MTKDQQVQTALDYWYQESAEDWKTAEDLLQLNRYHHCLFFCHLSLEKLIKGKIVEKIGKTPPPIHNLVSLFQQTSLPLDTTKQEQLEEITKFNLKARYDSYKREFYKKATQHYTQEWFQISQDLISWIKAQ